MSVTDIIAGAAPTQGGYLNALTKRAVIKPATAKGISGFVFDYDGETEIQLDSDVTDHYVEDNTAVQDHVSLRPRRITLHGYVAELVFRKPAGLLGLLGSAQSGLTQLNAYLGVNTPQMAQKIGSAITAATSALNTLNQTVARAQNIIGLFSRAGASPTKQQLAYSRLEALWWSRSIVTVETPFAYFRSMIIEALSFSQDPETKTWSEISVTLKEFRTADVGTAKFDSTSFAGRAGQQQAPAVDKGKTTGRTKTLALKLQESFF